MSIIYIDKTVTHFSVCEIFPPYFHIFIFYQTSIGDSISLDITFSSPDDGSLEQKCHSYD